MAKLQVWKNNKNNFKVWGQHEELYDRVSILGRLGTTVYRVRVQSEQAPNFQFVGLGAGKMYMFVCMYVIAYISLYSSRKSRLM